MSRHTIGLEILRYFLPNITNRDSLTLVLSASRQLYVFTSIIDRLIGLCLFVSLNDYIPLKTALCC